jgi:hypothetical protein
VERAWRHELDAASFHIRQEPVYVGMLNVHLDWIASFSIVLNCEGSNIPVSGALFSYSSWNLQCQTGSNIPVSGALFC